MEADIVYLMPHERRTFGQLRQVHSIWECLLWTPGAVCVVHNPMPGIWRGLALVWRDDKQIFERICPCGVGHPDPSQIPYWVVSHQHMKSIHGCCGEMCCSAWIPEGGETNAE